MRGTTGDRATKGVNSFGTYLTMPLTMSILLIESIISSISLFSSARPKATTHAVYLRLQVIQHISDKCFSYAKHRFILDLDY